MPSRLLVHGGELITFGSLGDGTRVMFRSADGASWTSTPTTRAGGRGPPIGPVAVSPAGVFVAANDGWQEWYERQRFFRSVDGVAWEALAAGSFAPSHPLTHIAWGELARGGACP